MAGGCSCNTLEAGVVGTKSRATRSTAWAQHRTADREEAEQEVADSCQVAADNRLRH